MTTPANQPYAPTEEQLQMYSADVFRSFGAPGVVGFHVPNGGWRDPATARKLKAAGVRPGVSDWVFFLPHGNYACVELKDHRGKQSSSQKDFQNDVEAIGGVYCIARTTDEIDRVFGRLGIIHKPQQMVTQDLQVEHAA
jgi:hypothetical protein